MHPSELVGKMAVRTEPASDKNGTYDYTFNTVPILIEKVTEYHIVYTVNQIWFGNQRSLLDSRYIDNNWVPYDELMATEEATSQEHQTDEPPIV